MRIADFVEIERLRAQAGKRLGDVHPNNLEFFAFEQTFGTTLGPKRGMGGAAMTRASVYVFRSAEDGRAAAFCAGEWRIMENWKPLEPVDFSG